MKTFKETNQFYLAENSIICSKCKKEYFHNKSDDIMEIQEFVSFSDIGGYSSVVGDESSYGFDLCQHCALEIMGEYYEYF